MKRRSVPLLILFALCLPFGIAAAWTILKTSPTKALPASAESLAAALADAKKERDNAAEHSNYLQAAAEYVVNPLPPRRNAIPGTGSNIVSKDVADSAINRAKDIADFEAFRSGSGDYSDRNRDFYTKRQAMMPRLRDIFGKEFDEANRVIFNERRLPILFPEMRRTWR